jgi:hypothetical protein
MGNERCLHDSREKETPDDEKLKRFIVSKGNGKNATWSR